MAVLSSDTSVTGPNTRSCENISESTIYSMIPSMVRSRIPVLTSLRRSAKAVPLQGPSLRRNAFTLSCVESMKEKDTYGYASTVASSRASTPTIRPESPEGGIASQELSLKMLPQQETGSGVSWDVAATGVKLWVTARAQAEQGGDSTALRSMHIDALRYMHMALPASLTALEIESLRASMSPLLIFPLAESREARDQRPPNVLRKGVAQAVCWVFAGLLLVLPVLLAFLNRLLQFERQHQVTERIITNGLDLTSALGERGLELQRAFMRFKDGRVGGACVDAGSWFVEGVVGGLNDGLDAVAQSRRKAP